jgi:hypothetical protein
MFKPKPVIAATPLQIQQSFAQHGLPLHRYARSPRLCDRHMCGGLDVAGGGIVYLAAAPSTDFVVVVLKSPLDAATFAALFGARPMAAERRSNTLLVYLRSAKTRLAIVRRIFHA